MGRWQFTPDTLNRLSSALNTAASSLSPQFASNIGCWSYDAFGNRTLEAMSTTPCANNPTPASWANYGTNNRFTTTSQAPGGAGYDAAGNVTYDGVNKYFYDTYGRICAVSQNIPVLGTTVMTGYLYDAEGRRIAKGTITNWGSCDPAVNGFQVMTEHDYILDLGGEQFTEMAMDANNSMASQHTNVWAGGKLLATFDHDGLHFYFDDPLGTRRSQTDYLGVVEQTCFSLPFGDGLTCSGSATTPTEHQFTGKERDSESGNDYFGDRYFASSMGRMLSPDPGNISAIFHMDDPQSWNGYAYAHNNPLRFTDPSGDTYQVCDANGKNCVDGMSDETFEDDEAKDKPNGEYFQNGTMFHKDANGNNVTDGTYKQTDVDMPGDAETNIAAMGRIASDGKGAINMMLTNYATTIATAGVGELIGPAVSGYIQASKLSMLKPLVTNPKLAEIVDELFQATDKVPGGTAGAVRFESESGIMLSPAGHAQDAQSIVGQLNNLLKNPNTSWSSRDQAVAKELIRDLENSLRGR